MSAYKPRGFVWGFFLFVLILGTSFGGFLTMSAMTADGKMQDCPYMGFAGYCTMDISGYLASWQQLFTSTVERFNTFALFAALVLVLAYFFVDLLVRKRIERPLFERWRSRELFDPLQLAFARGLIHPKLYS